MKNNKTTEIYLVRHGESQGNIHLFSGPDPELTEKGKQQALLRGKEFADISFTAIYASKLTRAKQTAELMKLNRNMEIKIYPDIHELEYGNLFNTRTEKSEQIVHELEKMWYQSENDIAWNHTHPAVPGMESHRTALDRFLPQLTMIAQTHMDETILVISHGDLMAALLVHLGIYQFKDFNTKKIHNTAYIHFTYADGTYSINNSKGIE